MALQQKTQFSFHQSGGSYLTNMLLELGVCFHTNRVSTTWHEPVDGIYRLRESFRQYLGFLYPRMMEQDLYCFPKGRVIRFTHYGPKPGECEAGPLHLVRDPRGVMLSIFDRFGKDRSFLDFLTSNCHRDGPDPVPFSLFNLYPAECWALFSSFLEASFRAGSGPDGYVSLRFEKLKADPVEQMRRVIAHLGVQASEEDLRAAHERSSKAAVHEATRRWAALYPDLGVAKGPKLKRGKTGGAGQSTKGRRSFRRSER